MTTGRGRRRGSADTRGRILEAARASFAERGFDGATMRDVAARAGVDAALVHHYFGSKQQLFVAAMELPIDFAAEVPRLLDGPASRIGERFTGFVLDLWDRPEVRPLLLGLVRSATTDPVAGAMMRRLLEEGPLLAIAAALDRPDARLRASLAGSQFIGLLLARYVVGVEPLASAEREAVVTAVGPTIQRYLVGDIGARAHGRATRSRPGVHGLVPAARLTDRRGPQRVGAVGTGESRLPGLSTQSGPAPVDSGAGPARLAGARRDVGADGSTRTRPGIRARLESDDRRRSRHGRRPRPRPGGAA